MNRLRNEGWKSNPIRMFILCKKCGEKSAELYQFLDGGLIKARCIKLGCNNPTQSFSKNEFEFLPPYTCPKCDKEMEPKQLKEDYTNACYYCKGCDSYIRLADLLPDKTK